MKQVAYKIYRQKFNGEHFQESTGIGFLHDDSLIVPMLSTGDIKKAYLREFILPKSMREYNGWNYGIVVYVAKLQDGSTVPQEWHVSYRSIEPADKK